MPSSRESPPITEFDRASRQLFAAAAGQGQMRSADYEFVKKALIRFAHGLSREDAEDVASLAIAEALLRVKDPRQPEILNPGAFLFRATRNRLLDLYRRHQTRSREMLVDQIEDALYGRRYYSQQDDAVARLFDENATAASLEDVLRAAEAAGDFLAVQVLNEWIDRAEASGKSPSNRAIGRALGISHTSVNQAITRARNYF
jgi:DNA-directed RNA polymerase specialized sigma24 family protein